MEELKVTPGEWVIDENKDIVSLESNIEGDIVCLQLEEWYESMKYWPANSKLLVNSKKMFKLLQKINTEFYEYKALAQGTNKAGLIFEAENLINEILEK